jgi:uncharacterized membrane protein YfcA
MEPLTLVWVVVGAVVLIGLGWVLLKFFFRLAKHVIIALVLGAALMLFWYQPWNWNRAAKKDPNVGKLAYVVGTGKFVGVVVGSDDAAGMWIVEKDGGYRTKYAKSRLVLKGK